MQGVTKYRDVINTMQYTRIPHTRMVLQMHGSLQIARKKSLTETSSKEASINFLHLLISTKLTGQ